MPSGVVSILGVLAAGLEDSAESAGGVADKLAVRTAGGASAAGQEDSAQPTGAAAYELAVGTSDGGAERVEAADGFGGGGF